MNSLMEKGFGALTMTTVDIADSLQAKGVLGEALTEDILKIDTNKLDPSKISAEDVPVIKVQSPESEKAEKKLAQSKGSRDGSASSSKSEAKSKVLADGNKKAKRILRLAAAKAQAEDNDTDNNEKTATGSDKVADATTDKSPSKSPKKEELKAVSPAISLTSLASPAKSLASPSRDGIERVRSANPRKLAKDVNRILVACEKLKWSDVETYLKKLQKDIADGKYTDPKPLNEIADQEFGWTPLMHAVRENLIPLAEKLLELGCDVNARNKV